MENTNNPEAIKRKQMMEDLSNLHDTELENKKIDQSENDKLANVDPEKYMETVQPTENNEVDVGGEEKLVEVNSLPNVGAFDFEKAISNGVETINDEPVEKTEHKVVNNTESVEKVEHEVVNNTEPVEKPKPETQKKTKKKKVEVDIITPTEAEKIKSKNAESTVKNTIENFTDLDEQAEISNKERIEHSENYEREMAKDLTDEEINKTFDEIYSDNGTIDTPKSDVKVEIIDAVAEHKASEEKRKTKKTTKKEKTITYYGGDGEITAFKNKISKNAKILRNIDVEDTSKISSVGINVKSAQERQDVYLKTVLPTLQPSIIVVPMIISGVVISMSAFSWPDIKEICLIEEKLNELDPAMPDYIYDKNRNFIEKRKKQLQLFYKHITAVSGYENKPSYDELFNKILKFPDFQQLFFAAYATTSQSKAHSFNIACGSCGSDNYVEVKPKDLCFLLNTNVNINNLVYYIEKGSSLDNSESAKVYKEFQKEKIVEMANTTYRTKKPLPNSQFIYDLKIPTIGEALSAMEDIIEVFKDKDLSHTDDYSGNTVYIDSSFGLTPDLMELRFYLYLHKLIVAQIVEENKETNSAKVSYVDFDDRQAIYNSVYNLSPEDYRVLITDETLSRLVRVSGIRHAIKGGKCKEPTCGEDLGNISVEPETLFFTIAQRELVY